MKTANNINRKSWDKMVENTILQNSMVETRPSLQSLANHGTGIPKAVFVGIGLCTPKGLSKKAPLDFLSMLITAEEVRKTIRSKHIVVVIADVHASSNGFNHTDIDTLAQEYSYIVNSFKSVSSNPFIKVVRASHIAKDPLYQDVLRKVESVSPIEDAPYFKMEVADIEYLSQLYGGSIAKIGWTVSKSNSLERKHDEVAFDSCYNKWVGKSLLSVYVKAARVFNDRAPKASPYIAINPDQRIILSGTEDVNCKFNLMQRAVTQETYNGVQKHLKNLVRMFNDNVCQLNSGQLQDKLQNLISIICNNNNGGNHEKLAA